MLRKFAKHTILFFIPVILGCVVLEAYTRKLPLRYTYIAEHLETNKDSIRVLVLGSSQMKNALNPEWLDIPGINMASGNQHINTDYKLYQGLKDRLPALETVVIELSYAHLELHQNKKEFWKNNIFHEYYDVNCFERPTWIKDRLIFFSNPPFYSDALYDFHFGEDEKPAFNSYGFDMNNYHDSFNKNKFLTDRIDSLSFQIPNKADIKLFSKNTDFLLNMLAGFKSDGHNVVIVTPPFYKTYLSKQNVEILKRRDSILENVEQQFTNVRLLELETDTVNFTVRDYKNHNHLNPDGARKFTSILNDFLRK